MADTHDEFETRRWLRQRLRELGTQYPDLKTAERQERLTEALTEEGVPCPEHRQGEDADGLKEADS
jgi:hypothetical protein